MTRRDWIERIPILLGGVAGAPALATLLTGCSVRDDAPARVLTGGLMDATRALAERIIPATDTPGALEAGVPAFIDRILADWATAADRDAFVDGLRTFVAAFRADHGVSFSEASVEAQSAFMRDADEAAYAAEPAERLPFFRLLKELVLVGYYTSEIGGTRELTWHAVPGRFDGCAALSEIGRSWVSYG